MANFIIISGAPGAGKTTLANLISKALNLPLFSKDTFKCLLADYIPGEGIEHTQSLGRSSVEVLKLIINELAKSEDSYIVESAFLNKFEDEFFKNLKSNNNFFQIYCSVDSSVAFERIKNRYESGERHACHQDHLRLDDIKQTIDDGAYEILDFENNLIIEIKDGFSGEEVVSKVREFLADCSDL